MSDLEKGIAKDIKAFIVSIKIPLYLISVLWLVKIYEVTQDVDLIRYGLYPRAVDGIIGIFAAPFLHSGWEHLISNTFPLLFVSIMLLYFYRRVSMQILIITWLATGLLVWLFARPAYHIGASGVLYGLLGFILWSGFFRRNTLAITLSLLTLAIYSGYFIGFEQKEGVSWESHMLGALVGFVLAFLFRNVAEPTEYHEGQGTTPTIRGRYFQPDIFEKTKYQRWIESQTHFEDDEA